jgi:hypothetical protein
MIVAASNTPTFPYHKRREPHPGIIAIIYTALLILSLVIYRILAHGAGFSNPFGSLEKAQQTFLQFPDAIRFTAIFQFSAAISLGLFTAVVISRLNFLGANATGVSIALFGGIAASLLITISSICSWILSQPGVANDLIIMHVLQLLAFLSGGVAHTVAIGLLMTGVAIPCLFGGYTPKWVAYLGLVLATTAGLSIISLIFPLATIFIPVTRLGSFIWLISTGFTLVKDRTVSQVS